MLLPNKKLKRMRFRINKLYLFLSAKKCFQLAAGATACLGFGWVASLKPFLKRLLTFFKCRVRPVPVVCLRLAFSLQLNLRILAAGKPHELHLFFWMWYELRPHLRHNVWDLLCLIPKLCVPLVIFECFLY
jgi:hypothetical protein